LRRLLGGEGFRRDEYLSAPVYRRGRASILLRWRTA
jgi:hypothetical protein